MKILLHSLGLIVLALAEVACYLFMKKSGLSTPVSVITAMGLCLPAFLLVGLKVPLDSSSRRHNTARYTRSGSMANSPSSRLVVRRPEVQTGDDDFRVPTSINSTQHTKSQAFRSELYTALSEKKREFTALLSEADGELSRFDYSVLKTLERNAPGSVEGVVTARKIYHALERRVRDIEHFLNSQEVTDPEKGRMLLLNDLEIKEENQLTALFKSQPIPPIKIFEVELQLRVLLKRISRRRSIFRPNEISQEIDARETEEHSSAQSDREEKERPPR